MLHYGQNESVPGDQEHHESLFEAVNAHNGPLVDYHPQMLLQCLLWGMYQVSVPVGTGLANNHSDKLEYVKEVLVLFYKSLKTSKDKGEDTLKIQPLLVDRILQKEELQTVSFFFFSFPRRPF